MKLNLFPFKNSIIVVVCFMLILFVLSIAFSSIVVYSSSKYNGITIVLDAGHGGRDGGSVGANGTIEKEINLKYTLALKEKLTRAGYRVELTRKTDDGLYSPLAKNKKLSDMKERFNIIQRTNPNLVISIHMNSFRASSASGAHTYYRADDEASKTCANLIQNAFARYCDTNTDTAKVGDYYILNCSYYTAVLIECGFISNPEEEAKLNTEEYQNKIIDAICSALLLYFGNSYTNI